MKQLAFFLVLVTLFSACKGRKKIEDKIYSRHLQKHVQLTILSTPDLDAETSLLLLNDGSDMEAMEVQAAIDSLYRKKKITSVVAVGILSSKREHDYGVAGYPDFQQRGAGAGKYAQFVRNELLPFIKKRSGVQKFQSVAIAGWSLGGLSALDIAWDNWDKIQKVGVFSGSLWWRDLDSSDTAYRDDRNRIIHQKIRSSRKRPRQQWWFYAGEREETSDRDKDGITDVVDDTRDLETIIKNKLPGADVTLVIDPAGKHDHASWRKHFPEFLEWAFGK